MLWPRQISLSLVTCALVACSIANAPEDPVPLDPDPACTVNCSVGDPCTDDSQCATQLCSAGSCTECTDDMSCGPDRICDMGTCVPSSKLNDGESCTSADECISGFCVDGVCCNAACDETCAACVASQTGVADGTCSGITAGIDPDNECTATGPDTCGVSGDGCSGTIGECMVYDASTECAPASCSMGMETTASLCDGSGSCVIGATTACSPYLCDPNGDTCLTSCTGPAECAMGNVCVNGSCVACTGVCLSGMPNPSIVFNNFERTFYYPNNLSNGIWLPGPQLIIAADFSQNGYWAHSASASGYPSDPNNDTAVHYGTMLVIPATNVVVRESVTSVPNPAANQIQLGTINLTNGAMSNWATANFSDNFTGICNFMSSSASDFYCFNGSTATIRQYSTTSGSANLTFVGAITLNQVPFNATNGSGWGGTFAWDGAFFYFPDSGTSSSTAYHVYQPNGAFVSSFQFGSPGDVHSLYFDWAIGRYTIHSGFGTYGGGTQYVCATCSPSGDSQAYMGPSPYHAGSQ